MDDPIAVQAYAPLADRLGRDLLIQIRDEHAANPNTCCGYSEGQACCIDYLVDSVVCSPCEGCRWKSWKSGPDCGEAEHPRCPRCGHCEHRHA